jgi:hypothetical protein
MLPLPPDVARAEVAQLAPLHAQLARELDAARVRLCEAEPEHSHGLYEKVLRYQRVLGRLDNRIRVAMLALAQAQSA